MNMQIRAAFIIFLLTVAFMVGVCSAYTPPKGVPNPSQFFSTFGEIDQTTPSVATSDNPKCTGWPTGATAGCYYIDNTHAQSTDSSNAYGYPNKPRTTIPTNAKTAGDLVYIHAGTYTLSHIVYGEGSAANPIWITGNSTSLPIFTNYMRIGRTGGTGTTSYVVVENLNFQPSGTSRGKVLIGSTVDNALVNRIIVRSCVLTGAGTSANAYAGGVADGGG